MRQLVDGVVRVKLAATGDPVQVTQPANRPPV
jgi:hypothetical protein